MSRYEKGRNRWGSSNNGPNSNSSDLGRQKHSASAISDDQALDALLASAESRSRTKLEQSKPQRKRWGDRNENARNSNSRQQNTNIMKKDDDYYRPQAKRQRRDDVKNEEKNDSKFSWGDDNGPDKTQQQNQEEGEEVTANPDKPNFGLSGALANDDKTGNVYNGIVLKFTEPPEARTPNTRWRLYVFKKKTSTNAKDNAENGSDGDLIEVLHISKQSAYLFGREAKVADIPVHHPSLSKQHCLLQYRALPDKNDREQKVRCKPYLMDLGSTNGTFINGVRIDDARYYELRKGDVITIGKSSREYVLLTENTTSADL